MAPTHITYKKQLLTLVAGALLIATPSFYTPTCTASTGSYSLIKDIAYASAQITKATCALWYRHPLFMTLATAGVLTGAYFGKRYYEQRSFGNNQQNFATAKQRLLETFHNPTPVYNAGAAQIELVKNLVRPCYERGLSWLELIPYYVKRSLAKIPVLNIRDFAKDDIDQFFENLEVDARVQQERNREILIRILTTINQQKPLAITSREEAAKAVGAQILLAPPAAHGALHQNPPPPYDAAPQH